MNDERLSPEERQLMLALARKAIEEAVAEADSAFADRLPADRLISGREWRPDLSEMPPALREPGACFVTLFMPDGELRGCIGGLEAVEPLALDVCHHAAAAALEDYRFQPVRPEEVALIKIEISRLTKPQALDYGRPEELPHLLHPQEDGVVLRDGFRRATFLPQVWEKLPDPQVFLSHLCQKMGAPADLWRHRKLTVEIYHVEEFHED